VKRKRGAYGLATYGHIDDNSLCAWVFDAGADMDAPVRARDTDRLVNAVIGVCSDGLSECTGIGERAESFERMAFETKGS